MNKRMLLKKDIKKPRKYNIICLVPFIDNKLDKLCQKVHKLLLGNQQHDNPYTGGQP